MSNETTPAAEAEVTAQEQATVDAAKDYGEKSIQVLKDAAHVRQNPGMYIGDVGNRGLHHLVYEVVHNSIDEAMAGYCRNIHVKIDVDGSVSVGDDGRGIPVGMHPVEMRPTLEVVMTVVGAGGKFDKGTYKVSAGLHGIGIKAVNALSEWTEVEVRRDGHVYQQDFERGKAVSDVRQIGVSKRNGTRITFRPDTEIFHELQFNYDTLESRLRELAFLNKGVNIKLTDEASGKEAIFKFEGGIQEFVEYLNRNDDKLHKSIYIEDDRDDIHVEIAFQYNNGEEERVFTYVNNVNTPVGGTHLSGFRGALTRTINHYGQKENLIKENLTPIGDDFREGLTAIVSVRVPHPQFESQTKIRLNNPEVEGIVQSVVNEHLGRFLEENPGPAKKIVQKVALSAEARMAAAKAKKQIIDRKNILSNNGLPGKLMDCTTKNRDESELFLVEGDSAGGSADGGRDRMYQAILPLRGKILNVEKARLEKMLDNAEICNIISAVGTDIGESENVDKRNYNKIILLTDADVDGSHIRTLLLTFFYRQMPRLVGDGYLYMAQPPLYKITQRKNIRYIQTNDEMAKQLSDRGLAGTKLTLADENDKVTSYEGDRLRALVELLATIENGLYILERRGLNLATLIANTKDGLLPQHRFLIDGQWHWFTKVEDLDAFRKAEEARRGGELPVADDEAAPAAGVAQVAQSNGNGVAQQLPHTEEQELHEVKGLNRGLDKLREFGFVVTDLLPPKSLAGQEPAPRYFLTHDDTKKPLFTLRELVAAVRYFGEKGMSITRFKGLGEMNPDELWDTTLDPQRRTLLRITLEDAVKADEMFRILMGDKVEPRREFIEKHALEVRNLDV